MDTLRWNVSSARRLSKASLRAPVPSCVRAGPDRRYKGMPSSNSRSISRRSGSVMSFFSSRPVRWLG